MLLRGGRLYSGTPRTRSPGFFMNNFRLSLVSVHPFFNYLCLQILFIQRNSQPQLPWMHSFKKGCNLAKRFFIYFSLFQISPAHLNVFKNIRIFENKFESFRNFTKISDKKLWINYHLILGPICHQTVITLLLKISLMDLNYIPSMWSTMLITVFQGELFKAYIFLLCN